MSEPFDAAIIDRDRYNRINSDFTGTRNVQSGHEVVEFRAQSMARIWLNDLPDNFAPHWHSALEIITPTENNYTIISGGEVYEVHPGEVLIIPPGEIHEITAPPRGKRFIFLMNIASLQKLKGFARIISILSKPVLIGPDSYEEIYSEVYSLLVQIRNEYFNDTEFADLSIQSLLLKLFVVLGENYTQQESLFSNASPTKRKEYIQLFNDTLDYIDKHFTEELSLSDIAANTGFSKFHFSRLFKQYTNYNFTDYLCFRRIKAAEELLVTPGASITDVAILSGFSSISTFNRIFKQQKGCTPSQYRKQNSEVKKRRIQ
ncbi:MAG: AraC family transcriptional regulator [Lachnospiraceae bacterium]|nr:AraC family transcriptional regulator [Lachnospiraceae bacterium]